MKKGDLREDLVKVPSFISCYKEQVEIWKKVIRELHHAASDENLLLPSSSPSINQALLYYKGYSLLKLPEGWFSYLGYASANEKIDTEVTKTVAESFFATEEDALRQVKLNLRKAFRFSSLKEFPSIIVAKEISSPGSNAVIEGLYSKESEEIWLSQEILSSYPKTFKTLLHETIHWHYKVDDNTKEQAKAYEEIVYHLLSR